MSICLSMIVKNEEHIIARCLRSAKPFIDSYSISDTGSTDNTMAIIREELAGVPGILMSDPWQDFSANRNLSLSRVTGDYAIIIDADEVLEHNSASIELDPAFDGFELRILRPGKFYRHIRILHNPSRWKWVGKVHETPIFGETPRLEKLEYPAIRAFFDSHQNTVGNKFLGHLKILESEPPTPRNVFYLAQTLSDLGRHEEAAQKYYQRADMGGWDEEAYYSLWKAAESLNILSRPIEEVAAAFFRAYIFRPSRLEALNSLCRLLRAGTRWEECYWLSAHLPKSPSSDTLFLDPNAEWQILEEHALAAYYLGKMDESKECFIRLSSSDIPGEARERTKKNLTYFS